MRANSSSAVLIITMIDWANLEYWKLFENITMQ